MDIAIGFWISNFRYWTICFNERLAFPYNGHIMLLASWKYIRVRKYKHTNYCEVIKCHYGSFFWKACQGQARFFLLCFVTLGHSTIILKSYLMLAVTLLLIWIPQFDFKSQLYWCICDVSNPSVGIDYMAYFKDKLRALWYVCKLNRIGQFKSLWACHFQWE